jgi:SPP1 family predicted phage head-tail adaptor
VIAAGDLRHRVTFELATLANDTFGQAIKTWADQWTAWGRVRVLAGREGEIARQRRADATHAIDLRGPRTILPTGRFRWTDNNGVTHTADVSEPARDVDGDASHLIVFVIEVPDQA